jgi:hypothetical protein
MIEWSKEEHEHYGFESFVSVMLVQAAQNKFYEDGDIVGDIIRYL